MNIIMVFMKPNVLLPVVAFLCSGIVTAIVMPWLLKLCKAKRLYDLPDERKVHRHNIPRLGGAVFVPAILTGMCITIYLLFHIDRSFPAFHPSSFAMVTGVFIIYLIGLLDDLLGLRASFKFGIQLVTALFLPFFGLYVNDFYGLFGLHELPVYAGYPLTVFLCLLIVNSINLIDGIDGLASGLSFIALLAFTILFGKLQVLIYTLLTASLMGTLLVFMYYNLCGKVEKGTKIFMGDTGSLILGYALAYLVMKYSMSNHAVLPPRPHALIVASTLLIVPMFDLARVALTRLFRHKGMFHPDKTHIHHLFMSAGFSMRASLICILLSQLGFIAMNMFLLWVNLSPTWILLMDVAVYAIIVVILQRGHKEMDTSNDKSNQN